MSATVHVSRIIGTETRVVTAWEPYAGHTTMRHESGVALGLVTARPLPATIEAMRGGSPERMSAAIDFHAANVVDALAAIEREWPGLLDREGARISSGRVTIEGELER